MYKTRHKATEWGKKTMKQPVLLCYNLTGEKMPFMAASTSLMAS
mgnify:CR=1 FL=1